MRKLTRHAVLRRIMHYMAAWVVSIPKGEAPYFVFRTQMNVVKGDRVVEIEYTFVGCDN